VRAASASTAPGPISSTASRTLTILPPRGSVRRFARRRSASASSGSDSTATTMSLAILTDQAQQPVAGLGERGIDVERLERMGQPAAVILAQGPGRAPARVHGPLYRRFHPVCFLRFWPPSL
jgi:hypothetical protein